jgi:N-acetylmuramoyl-L-alanine amidase
MGKIIRAFFFWLMLCASLCAANNYMQQLEGYDSKIDQHVSNDELLRVFHGLKSIYIQAIISGDQTLKKETLERLIKTAKILKIDASKYESELATMQKVSKKASGTTAPAKALIPPPAREESFSEGPKTLPTPAPSKSTNEEQKVTPSSSSTHVASLPKTFHGKNVLQTITTQNDAIVLEFGDTLPEKAIKVFVLKSDKSYKKVIDVPAVILNAPLAIKTPEKLQNLRVSQYSGETIRIVLDAEQSFETYVSVLSNQLIISLGKQPMLTQKKLPAPKASIPTPSHFAVEEPDNKKVSAPKPALLSKNAVKNIRRDKTIVIDAGHGGKDAGAIGYKQRMEKHLVLELALQLGKELRERGYKVYFTRQRDVFINLRDRTKMANDKSADLFLSLHANAAPNEAKRLSMKGLETFFLSPDRSERSKNVAALENQSDIEEMDFYSKETFLNVFNREKIVLSNKAAIDIQSNMLKHVRSKYTVDDGGVREAPFWVLVGATMPSILIEVGYITNPEESDRMFNPQYQKILVEGVGNGIDQYFTNNP